MNEVATGSPELGIHNRDNFGRMFRFLGENGKLVTTEVPLSNKAIKENILLRNICFYTKLRLPLIGTTFIHPFLLRISQEVDRETNKPVDSIKLSLFETKEYVDTRDLTSYPGSPKATIYVSKDETEGEKVSINADNLKEMQRFFGLDQSQWIKDDSTPRRSQTVAPSQIAKIVGTFTDMEPMFEDSPNGYYHNKQSSLEPKLSRRSFLRLVKTGIGAFALDSIIGHMPGYPSFTKSFWEQLETLTLGSSPEDWIRYFKDHLGIKIQQPQEVQNLRYKGKDYPSIEWDTPRLKSLFFALVDLPSNFRANGKLKAALADPSFFSEAALGIQGQGLHPAGYCACYNPDQPLVVFDKRLLGQTFLEQSSARSLMVHELTHVITTPDIQKYIASICVPIGIEKRSDLWRVFSSEIVIHRGSKTDDQLTFDDIENKSYIGYGAKNFYEFFSRAAQSYVQGKDVFLDTYTKFLGKARAEKLYEGMKREIFQGKEYNDSAF